MFKYIQSTSALGGVEGEGAEGEGDVQVKPLTKGRLGSVR